jgi:hypothetical protein
MADERGRVVRISAFQWEGDIQSLKSWMDTAMHLGPMDIWHCVEKYSQTLVLHAHSRVEVPLHDYILYTDGMIFCVHRIGFEEVWKDLSNPIRLHLDKWEWMRIATAAIVRMKSAREKVGELREKLEDPRSRGSEISPEARTVIANLLDAWSRSWDCSGDPGHGIMNKAVASAEGFLESSEGPGTGVRLEDVMYVMEELWRTQGAPNTGYARLIAKLDEDGLEWRTKTEADGLEILRVWARVGDLLHDYRECSASGFDRLCEHYVPRGKDVCTGRCPLGIRIRGFRRFCPRVEKLGRERFDPSTPQHRIMLEFLLAYTQALVEDVARRMY